MRTFAVVMVLGWGALTAHAQPVTPGRMLSDCPTCPDMVVIPTGSLSMGTAPATFELDTVGRAKAESGVVKIDIMQSFALGSTEVTRGQYGAFIAATKYKPRADAADCRVWDQARQGFGDKAGELWRTPGLLTTQRDEHPVTCVSWDDAVAYTQWLSKETGKRYRLPTEAEWEYAARAGSSRKRFWGDEAGEGCAYANIYDLTARRAYPLSMTHVGCADGFSDVAPVGSLLPNNFGLHDMIGNVEEWVADCFTESKVGRPKDQRAWVWDNCPERALRGGSWASPPDVGRVGRPAGDKPSFSYAFLGFRVARDLAPGEDK